MWSLRRDQFDFNAPTVADKLKSKVRDARVVRIVDGDTIHVVVKMRKVCYRFIIRLAGINSPELRSKDPDEVTKALAAKTALATFLHSDKEDLDKKCCMCKIIVTGVDKYGRLLANVFVGEEWINTKMVSTGHAVPYM